LVISTLSLHDALPICCMIAIRIPIINTNSKILAHVRSFYLLCRLTKWRYAFKVISSRYQKAQRQDDNLFEKNGYLCGSRYFFTDFTDTRFAFSKRTQRETYG